VWHTAKNGTRHARADCAECGMFSRYLDQPDAPAVKHEPCDPGASSASTAAPPATWRWIGWIRQSDMVWRPVAEAPTLGRCWDALLHYPGDGDRLCIPSRPENGAK
jgi:hypothetical protein